MKKYTLLKLILILLFISLTLSGCENINTNTSYINIQGRITDYNTALPLEGALIKAGNNNVYSNSNGYYQIKNLLVYNNHLKITCQNEDYFTESRDIFIPSGTTEKIIDFSLKRCKDYSGSIFGKVTIHSQYSMNKASIPETPQISKIKSPLNNQFNESNYVPGEILVKFKPGTETKSSSKTGVAMNKIVSSEEPIYKIKATNNMTTEELYNYYENQEDVELVSYNHIGYLMSLPNDTYLEAQWQVDKMFLPQAWNISTGSSAVTVAVIDTGYLPHPDLVDNLDTYNDYDFVDEDTDAYDEDSYYENDRNFRVSHGTHVAGIIGAVGNNNEGIAGVNWHVNILPLRIFRVDYNSGQQFFTEEDLFRAISYATENGADVINLSLAFTTGGAVEHNLTESALAEAYRRGITIVAAAGNDNKSYVYYPASSTYTIAVGATGPDNKITWYSNYGNRLDLLAPGGDMSRDSSGGILSTHKFNNKTESDYDYIFMEGTSMAAPQVAGVTALLINEGIRDPEEIREILKETALPLCDSLSNVGLLNAHAALNKALYPNNSYEAKVMATIKDDNTYYIVSDEALVNSQGKYSIYQAKTNVGLTVIGWIDSNNNDYIDKGDYFGEAIEEIYLYDGEKREGVNISMYYQYDTTPLSSNKIKVVYGLPEEND